MTNSNFSYDTPTIKLIYKIGLLIMIPAVIGFCFLHTDFAKQALLLNTDGCSIKAMTGLPCPGCGGTRATFLLAYFHILQSIKYNASVFTGVLFYLIFMTVEILHFRFNSRGFSEKGFFVMLYTWVAVAVIHWVIKISMIFLI